LVLDKQYFQENEVIENIADIKNNFKESINEKYKEY